MGLPGADATGMAWSAKRTDFVSLSGSGTTNWTTIPGMSLNVNLQAPSLVQLTATGTQHTRSGTNHAAFRFVIDGVAVGDLTHGQMVQQGSAGTPWMPWTLGHFENLAAGPHSIEVQTRNSSPFGSRDAWICGRDDLLFGYTDCTLNAIAVGQ